MVTARMIAPARLCKLAAVLAAGLLLVGCQTYQVLPGEERPIAEQKKLGLVVEVHMYLNEDELKADDPEVTDARKSIEADYMEALGDKGYAVTMLPDAAAVRALVTQYALVRGAPPPKMFAVSQGKIAGLAALPGAGGVAEKAGVDRILVVTHVYTKLSFGRVLLMSLIGAALGGGPPHVPPPKVSQDVAMIDNTGRVVFYESMGGGKKVARELAELPETVKAEAGQRPSHGDSLAQESGIRDGGVK